MVSAAGNLAEESTGRGVWAAGRWAGILAGMKVWDSDWRCRDIVVLESREISGEERGIT